MVRWGMIIDLKKCNGCYSCFIACKQENKLPSGILWNRVVIGESGKYPTVTKEILPVNCNHCSDPPCVNVCPTGASVKREDGIVVIDYDKCFGCKYCIIACPYQQRSFINEFGQYFPGYDTIYDEMPRNIYQKGVTVKCTFCVNRVDAGVKKGLKPGIDREATPACVITCPTKARYFGDLDDPNSEVSQLIKQKRAFQIHPEYRTGPSVYYIK